MSGIGVSRRTGWRGAMAAWSAAAWLVMRQFDVPVARALPREIAIVRLEDASRSLRRLETLPDGRIMTIPVEVPKTLDRNHLLILTVDEVASLN